MANFTTVDEVRLRCKIEDEAVAPDTLVQASIDDAHARIASILEPGIDTVSPPDLLRQGETMLAGALLMASLASGEAVSTRPITVGGQRIEAGKRFASLMAVSERLEEEAWTLLSPYLRARPSTTPGGATDTTAVLGAR